MRNAGVHRHCLYNGMSVFMFVCVRVCVCVCVQQSFLCKQRDIAALAEIHEQERNNVNKESLRETERLIETDRDGYREAGILKQTDGGTGKERL